MTGKGVSFTRETAVRLMKMLRAFEAGGGQGGPVLPGEGKPRILPQTLFAVRVTPDGGSAGSVSTTCSFTYTVKLDSGTSLGTGKSPQKRRLPNVPYATTPANTWGAAFFDKDNALVLWDANELPQVEDPCPEA